MSNLSVESFLETIHRVFIEQNTLKLILFLMKDRDQKSLGFVCIGDTRHSTTQSYIRSNYYHNVCS
jgi:hypothetical protein